MTAQQERKRHIRAFMQNHYTDERLAMLLAHARDGKLVYGSCCCFIGIPTADHALRGQAKGIGEVWVPHYNLALRTFGPTAGLAYAELATRKLSRDDSNKMRRRILIPMIRAEMRRRERLRQFEELPDEVSKANPMREVVA